MKRALALARLGSIAAAAAVPLTARAQGTPITLVGAPNDSGGELFYAQELGLFAKARLDTRMQVLNNPTAVVAGVVTGSIAIGAITVPGILLARQRGIALVIVAPTAIYSKAAPTSGVIVLKDSPLRRAADLNGKTIATRDLGNLSYYGAKAWIDQNGGDSSSVRWVEINDPQAVAAMQAGRCDAASLSNPAFDDALHDGAARLFANCYDAIADHFLIAAHFTTSAYASAHPEVVRRFRDVMLGAGRWANAHHAQSAKILEKYIGAPVSPTNMRVTYAERIRPSDAQPVVDVLVKYGVLKSTIDARELFAPEVL